METTNYCLYELSKALKAAGFDEPCRAHYTDDYVNEDPEDTSHEVKFHYDWTSPYNYNRVVGNTSAPTLWQAQKWLREKYGIHVDVYPDADISIDADGRVCNEWYCWDAELLRVETGGFIAMPANNCDSYEQALSIGISAALELIKKGE